MVIAEITAALQGIKASVAIIKGLNSVKNDVEKNSAVLDLQNVILDIQTNLLALQEKHNHLLNEKEELYKLLKEKDSWEDIKKNYEKTEIADGIFVFQSTEESDNSWYCSNCFLQNSLSILQRRAPKSPIYDCQKCNSKIKTNSEASITVTAVTNANSKLIDRSGIF